MGFAYDVAIIGGCGHVGLPLGLAFARKNAKVIAIDINKDSADKVNNKEMPFLEPQAKPLLEQAVEEKKFLATTEEKYAGDAQFIVFVPGTPVGEDMLPEFEDIENALNSILNYLKSGQTIILRSTLAPKTTDYIKKYIEEKTSFAIGKNLFLAFAPERIVQSNALEELEKLPQIIGVYDDLTYKKVHDLFIRICPETLKTTPLEAELAKLFTNNYRYVNFGLANEFFLIAHNLGANIFNVVNALNHNYDRANVPKPGFAKGPCLGKDAWILVSSSASLSSFSGIISSAFHVNEGMPAFIVDEIKKKMDSTPLKVALLGLTFKSDCDDTRDSLSLKLLKILKNQFSNVKTHDPYVDNKNLKNTLSDRNVVVIAVNHSAYESIDISKMVKKGTLIVDIWNNQKTNEVFYTA